MKRLTATISFLWITMAGFAQQKTTSTKNNFADFTAAIGSNQGSVAASYVYNWKFGFGKKKAWEAGIGARFTSSFGNNNLFTTAGPARLTRTNSTPVLLLFSDFIQENIDTLTVRKPFTSALNITANAGYNFSKKWSAGFNIDLIGFSFGKKSSSILTSNGFNTTEPFTKSSPFNILLTDDHDYGSLNSEFFIKYKLNNRFAVRGIYQFLITEYQTTTINQTAPDGTVVKRFHNKANNYGIGISYHF